MATAGITVGLHEDRHHVQSEADRPIVTSLFRFDGHLDRLPAKHDGQFALAVGLGRQRVAVQGHRLGIGERKLGLAGHVARQSIGIRRLHDQRLTISLRGQFDRSGRNCQQGQRRLGRLGGHGGTRHSQQRSAGRQQV